MSGPKPVIRMMFVKMKEAWHCLSEEEKAAFMQRDRQNLDALGMAPITVVDCRWSNEDWDFIGVEEWARNAGVLCWARKGAAMIGSGILRAQHER